MFMLKLYCKNRNSDLVTRKLDILDVENIKYLLNYTMLKLFFEHFSYFDFDMIKKG